GVGIVLNGSGPYHNYYTIDQGNTSDTRPFLTGVVYNDTNNNGVYDNGEGLGNVTITIGGGGSFQTWGPGGYRIQLGAGTYTVTASGGSLASPITRTVTVGSSNYRLNFVGNADNLTLSPVADQTVAAGGHVNVTLSATDSLGRPITYSGTAVSLAYALDQQYGFSSNGNLYFNYGGRQDKWFQGSGGWYFILPSGGVYRWDGTANQASGTLIATVDTSYYTNPATLYNATPGTPNATVTANGNVLTITPNTGFSGTFAVQATATDGSVS